MRPVAIFRFSPGDEPGHFADWLAARGHPWRLIALHDGEPVPTSSAHCAGIGMMGGPMSVNDGLPWVPPMESLLRDAVARGVPVIGHCLGGQLLAKALGARVARAAVGELAAGIAHDFNNILSIVKGSAQIIEDNLDQPEKIRTRADRIKTVAEQGAGIVQAMLGFSRSSDELLAPCDPNAVVEDTLKLLGDRFTGAPGVCRPGL